MGIKSFSQALDFLYSYVPKERKKRFTKDWGLARTKYVLKLLGNPQNKLKVIHIAGTSGKGSTAYLTSLLLHSLGFRTGLHLSPHLEDIRERAQINNQLISKMSFVQYLSKLKPFIVQVENSKFGKPTYFEILAVLAFYIFWREKVDYAVVETGLGGMYDATNTVNNKDKLVVITRIGKDHTQILGERLSEISQQKAAIIQDKNKVIALAQSKQINTAVERQVAKKEAKLHYVEKNKTFSHVSVDFTKTQFDFSFKGIKLSNLELGLLGQHQVENASLALASTILLSERDNFDFAEEQVRNALIIARFPGRMEVFHHNEKRIIIDAAHNPQKIRALAQYLQKIMLNEKFIFLVAFKRDKNIQSAMEQIAALADSIIITRFALEAQDFLHLSKNPEEITAVLDRIGYKKYKIVNNAYKAFLHGFKKERKTLIITGSLYLLAQLYGKIKQG